MSSPSSIPVEAKSFNYSPECFEDLDGAPVFTIRFGTRRDRHAFQDEVRLRRLRSHDKHGFRAAYISEFRTKWATDGVDPNAVVDAIERYFTATDEMEAAQKEWLEQAGPLIEANTAAEAKGKPLAELPPLPSLEFDAAEQERVENLLNDIEDHSDRIGRMHRDNGRREREIRRIALSLLLDSTTLPVEIRRGRDGEVTDDTLYEIEEALERFSDDDEHRGGVAFLQLGTKALLSWFLDKEQEKNSASPSFTTTEKAGSTAPATTNSTTATTSKAPDADPIPSTSSPSGTPT